MDLLFNHTFLDHNIGSAYEGSYRLNAFSDIENTDSDGEEFLSLVHTEKYIEKISDNPNPYD